MQTLVKQVGVTRLDGASEKHIAHAREVLE
jgi:hypothetical protein